MSKQLTRRIPFLVWLAQVLLLVAPTSRQRLVSFAFLHPQHATTNRHRALFAVTKQTQSTSQAASLPVGTKISKVSVGKEIGSGSYGTVHILNATTTRGEQLSLIGKRPWTKDELSPQGEDSPKDRAARCMYYWQVEDHCFERLPPHPQLPPYYGTSDEWMLFGLVGDQGSVTPAPTLSDLMKKDCDHPQDLKHIAEALGCDSFASAMDKTIESLLTVLSHIHENQIIHRDIKPSNLLVNDGTLLLMDFGSAADLEPSGGILKRRRGLENGNRVAVSPIYCAPEVFVDVNYHPTKFDMFSSALLICQLLFAYLDERIDAGFHQQLQEVDWDLNAWLSNDLAGKVRPQGLSHALDYLGERPGLWTLLQDMLAKDPGYRPTASEALVRFKRIMDDDGMEDGPFFTMVMESMDSCEIPTMSRPLNFVATFSQSRPLGLVLSEMDGDDDGDDLDDMDEKSRILWKEATKDALEGEVFVKGIVEGGQAAELGIFEIGDRLQGIGELPFFDGGFEKALRMLQDQPKNTKTVKLHFDRLSVRRNEAIAMVPREDVEINIVDRGAWSFKGRRKAQEDRFVLHEIHDTRDRSVLLAGVFDGHGGTAASTMAAETLPSLVSQELLFNTSIPSVEDVLVSAWETVGEAYRLTCSDSDTCSADYDPKEGTLNANTGSEDLIAGTTASIFGLDETTGSLTFMNCGDSRSILIDNSGKVVFETSDHTLQAEQQRFLQGVEAGLNYSVPECFLSRWWLPVGEYEYALGRSLEGPFATSKGIISVPDVVTLKAEPGMIIVSASDGLYDVMDSEEVAHYLARARDVSKMTASDAAKTLSNRALEKGTPDNVSVVVVYL